MRATLSILLSILFLFSAKAQEPSSENLSWSVATQLPNAPGQEEQLGLAGVSGGVHNDVLLIAGGANFPDLMPWHGGIKKYWEDIYVLLKDGSGRYTWHDSIFRLPEPLAYPASVDTGNGILLIGGENEAGIQSSVFLLQWDAVNQEVLVKTMPALPIPLTNAAAGVIGNRIFVVGGETEGRTSDKMFYLDLPDASAWKELPPLPMALSHASAVVQSNGEYPCLYLI